MIFMQQHIKSSNALLKPRAITKSQMYG